MSLGELAGLVVRIIGAILRMVFVSPWAFFLIAAVIVDWFDRMRTAWGNEDGRWSVFSEMFDDIVSLVAITIAHAMQPGWWWAVLVYATWKLCRIKSLPWIAQARGRWWGEFMDDLVKWAPAVLGVTLFLQGVTRETFGGAVEGFANTYRVIDQPEIAIPLLFQLAFTAPFVFLLLASMVQQSWQKARESGAEGGATFIWLALADDIISVLTFTIMLTGSWWTLIALIGYLGWKATYLETFPWFTETWITAVAQDARLAASFIVAVGLLANVLSGGQIYQNMAQYWDYLVGDFQPPPPIDFGGTFNPGSEAPPAGPIFAPPDTGAPEMLPTLMPVTSVAPAIPTAVPTPPLVVPSGEFVPLDPNQPLPQQAP